MMLNWENNVNFYLFVLKNMFCYFMLFYVIFCYVFLCFLMCYVICYVHFRCPFSLVFCSSIIFLEPAQQISIFFCFFVAA